MDGDQKQASNLHVDHLIPYLENRRYCHSHLFESTQCRLRQILFLI